MRKHIVPLERFVMGQGEAMTALDTLITDGVGLSNSTSLFCVY
jgi:hypothetical protein